MRWSKGFVRPRVRQETGPCFLLLIDGCQVRLKKCTCIIYVGSHNGHGSGVGRWAYQRVRGFLD